MNIATAKEQIKNAVRIYLQKNADGSYQIPVVHQRPVFVMGPPGLGKQPSCSRSRMKWASAS